MPTEGARVGRRSRSTRARKWRKCYYYSYLRRVSEVDVGLGDIGGPFPNLAPCRRFLPLLPLSNLSPLKFLSHSPYPSAGPSIYLIPSAFHSLPRPPLRPSVCRFPFLCLWVCLSQFRFLYLSPVRVFTCVQNATCIIMCCVTSHWIRPCRRARHLWSRCVRKDTTYRSLISPDLSDITTWLLSSAPPPPARPHPGHRRRVSWVVRLVCASSAAFPGIAGCTVGMAIIVPFRLSAARYPVHCVGYQVEDICFVVCGRQSPR